MRYVRLLVVLVTALGGTAAHAVQDEACNLTGKTFLSKDLLEVGVGLQGPNKGRWSIAFKRIKNRDVLEWNYSDMQQTFFYSCKNGDIAAEDSKPPLTGAYDIVKKQLSWNDVLYLEQK